MLKKYVINIKATLYVESFKRFRNVCHAIKISFSECKPVSVFRQTPVAN